MTDTIRVLIYHTESQIIVMEYVLIADVIEIINCDIRMKPISAFQEREQRRAVPVGGTAGGGP